VGANVLEALVVFKHDNMKEHRKTVGEFTSRR
jgi:hypothetical protein